MNGPDFFERSLLLLEYKKSAKSWPSFPFGCVFVESSSHHLMADLDIGWTAAYLMSFLYFRDESTQF